MPETDHKAEGSSSPEKAASSRLFCCTSVRRWIPLALREEIYHIMQLVGPLLVCRTLNYLLPVVVTMFVGRLGTSALAGYAMACAIYNMTGAATGIGLCFACDTLIAQTFGARNLQRVGVILQKGIIILLIHTLLCWALLVNTRAILLVLGQEPEVARIAEIYVMAYLPALPALFMHQLLTSYLQNQGIIPPMVYSAIMSNVASVLTNYALVSWLDLGIIGSAAANSLSIIYNLLFLFLYIWLRKLHVNTWGGWSTDSLQEWGSFMKLAIPSLFMCCLEWWVYEIGGFLAGMLSELDLAAQHVVIMLAYINYMIPLGAQGAACIRVGNALGAGDTAGAILTTKVVLIATAVLAVIQCIVLGATKDFIGYIFTDDVTIAAVVSKLFDVYAVMQFFTSLTCVSMGILLGMGQQKVAAVAHFVSYYIVGLPVLIALMFAAKLDVLGFWLGLFIATVMLTVICIVVLFKLDWKKMTKEAVERAGKTVCLELMTSLSEPEPDLLTSGSKRVVQAENGHGSLVYQELEGLKAPVSESQHHQPAALLSSSQLLLRRGLTTLAALLILAVGISVHLLMPLPESSWSSVGNATMEDGNWTTTASPLEQSTVISLTELL
ncbi:multidrug and toxin extrusion protein 1-like [Engraulis encrasicolus]|uniref:multidrug and toxin extrusion protein 1-like n=1 Tax=Engraulis encrasicolus TaxID=184585 RepID=UPI002FD0A7A0